jgi:hypothetical protein
LGVKDYIELVEGQRQQYQHLMQTERYKETEAMMTTTWEKGKAEGQRRLVRLFLERRFGPLSSRVQAKLDAWPPEKLEELFLAADQGASLEALGLGEETPNR